MFFIKWVIKFLKGKNLVHTNEPDKFDFELLKIKKCSKDYVDLSKILKMKIKILILFANNSQKKVKSILDLSNSMEN